MAEDIATSEVLIKGDVYTRAALTEMFDIADATINTGIFQPKGHRSVWLFVTERKTSDRTPYADRLEGDDLYWQGQTMGHKDALIIEHEQRGLELLVFYRRKKYEYAGAGFRYEGQFRYISHSGSRPTSFILKRAAAPESGARSGPAESNIDPLREFLERLDALHVWTRGTERAPHKPLLVLVALTRLRHGLPRLMEFIDVEDQLRKLIGLVAPDSRGHPEYPFWRLQADGIWEIPDARDVSSRASNSDPPVSELRVKRVQGGFPQPYYAALRADRRGLEEAVRIAVSKVPDGARDEVVLRLGWSALFDAPAIDTDYVDVDGLPLPQAPALAEPDPDLFGRGLEAHRSTQTALARWLNAHGVEPRSPTRSDAAFDLLWRCDGLTFVCEVKSVTDANEERQLRLGLGQVLRYRQAVHQHEAPVVPVLVTERAPSDDSWVTLCNEVGVLLVWPDTFPILLETNSTP